MMAFIDYDVTVVLHNAESVPSTDKTLQGRNIDDAGRFLLHSSPHSYVMFIKR